MCVCVVVFVVSYPVFLLLLILLLLLIILLRLICYREIICCCCFFLNKKKRKKIESKNYAYLLSFSFLLRAHALSLSLSFFSVSRFRYPTFSNYAASTIERTYYILHLIQPATTKKGSKTTMKRRQANQRAIYIYRETITTTATSTYIYT